MIQYFPIVTGSLTVLGNINVSGSITTSGSITISGSITSASFASTASYWSGSIVNAESASFASTASFVANAQTASYVLNAVSSSFASTASFVALAQSASNAVSAVTASFANNLTVAGTLTAQTLVVQTITSSVDFVTGSTRFGSLSSNTHIITGSMYVTGAFYVTTGSVGIGTISPNRLLDVSNTSGDSTIAITSADTTGQSSLFFAKTSDSNIGGVLYTHSDNVMAFRVNDATRLTIASTGAATFSSSVTAGGTNIQLNSDGTYGSTYYTIGFGGVTNGYNRIFAASSAVDGLYIASATGYGIIFRTNGAATNNMTITSGGNVLVATTSNSTNNIGGPRNFTIGNVNTAGTGRDVWIYMDDSDMRLYTNNTQRLNIASDGLVSFNSNVYNRTAAATSRTLYIGGDYYIGGISSIRASKKNIEDVSNIDWLYQLNPVTFNYRKKDEEGNYTEETFEDLNYGLIAEDTQPIADFLINYDETKDGKKMIGIEYSRLITPMLKAIQELNTKFEEYKATHP